MEKDLDDKIQRAASLGAPDLAKRTGESVEECKDFLITMLREIEEEHRKVNDQLRRQQGLWLNRRNN